MRAPPRQPGQRLVELMSAKLRQLALRRDLIPGKRLQRHVLMLALPQRPDRQPDRQPGLMPGKLLQQLALQRDPMRAKLPMRGKLPMLARRQPPGPMLGKPRLLARLPAELMLGRPQRLGKRRPPKLLLVPRLVAKRR